MVKGFSNFFHKIHCKIGKKWHFFFLSFFFLHSGGSNFWAFEHSAKIPSSLEALVCQTLFWMTLYLLVFFIFERQTSNPRNLDRFNLFLMILLRRCHISCLSRHRLSVTINSLFLNQNRNGLCSSCHLLAYNKEGE